MMLIPKRHAWFVVAGTLLAALLGAESGYLIGRSHIQRTANLHLTQAALQTGGPFVSLMDESSALLAQLNASPFPRCSDAEIASFRQLLFHSEYLRDAGRMHNGRIECSTLFGPNQLSSSAFQPAITNQDGLKIYRDVPPYLSPKWVVFLLQKGDTFVVEDLSMKNNWHPPSLDYESTLRDAVSGKRVRPGGKSIISPDAVLGSNAQGQIGNRLYVTVCWPNSTFCTTVFEPVSTSLSENRGLLTLDFLLYQHSRNMGQQLLRAIRSGDLRLVYQPIVELSSGRIVEAEALARWTDEDGYAVSPEIFVRLAEERGFVGELTEWVVRKVLHDFGAQLLLDPELQINVNVTVTDLGDSRFLPMMDRSLAEFGIPARSLAIEVTEGSTASKKVAVDAIRQLRQRGHSVQVDDFGTGYSSLSYLKDLDVDTIKIDKAFTQSIGTDAVTVAILPLMLSMAESLNLNVIVEGIETVEQADYFAGQHIDVLGQGWFFGRPGSAEDLLRALANQKDLVVMERGAG